MKDTRLTLITRGAAGESRPVFVDSFAIFRWALTSRVGTAHLDVERAIIDRAASADDFLTLLSSVTPETRADILFIDHDDSGYLSARGRGDERVLYALSAMDVQFYLQAGLHAA